MEDVETASSGHTQRPRGGSLSRYMDGRSERNRRNSSSSCSSEHENDTPNEYQSEIMGIIAMEDKAKAIDRLLNLEVEMIFDGLEESESGLRNWLLQYDVVKEVLLVFSTPVVFPAAPKLFAQKVFDDMENGNNGAEDQTYSLPTSEETTSGEDPVAETNSGEATSDEPPPGLLAPPTPRVLAPKPTTVMPNFKVDEEYGYYKRTFVCSEIIMRVYTGDEDLYESFRMSSSSSGSASEELTFGCQTLEELELWRLFFVYFSANSTIDEVQAAFYCKAFIRLHDAYCLEDGYVQVVLEPYMPALLKHIYLPTIKHLLLKLLQSYESIHPLTGVHDAMEAVAPMLVQALKTPIALSSPLLANDIAARENVCRLMMEMLQANQADRLGSFLRREDNQFLAKYFVRDQFGTIRGIEAVTEGYHNFLQFMLLEELGKDVQANGGSMLETMFQASYDQLQDMRSWPASLTAPCVLNIHVTSELVRIYCRNWRAYETKKRSEQPPAADVDVDDEEETSTTSSSSRSSSPNPNASVMYELSGLKSADGLWPKLRQLTRSCAPHYVTLFQHKDFALPTSVDVGLAKLLYRLITAQDPDIDAALAAGNLVPKYVQLLQDKPQADMLLIHVVSALLYLITDKSRCRSATCSLIGSMFSLNLLDVIVHVFNDHVASKPYFKVLNDAMLVMSTSEHPSPSQRRIVEHSNKHAAWQALNSESKRRLGLRSQPPAESVHEPSEKAESDVSPDEARDVVAYDEDDDEVKTDLKETPGDDEGPLTPLPEAPAEPEPPTAEEPPKRTRRLSIPKSAGYLKNVLSSPAASVMRNVGALNARRSFTARVSTPTETSATPNPSTKPNISHGAASQLLGFGTSVLSKFKSRMVTTSPPPSSSPASPGSLTYKRSLTSPFSRKPYEASAHASLLVLDTSLGDDVTKCAVYDGGVTVATKDECVVVTSGYMFKSGMPDVGKRHVWERYYFVLERGGGLSTLSYYVSESQAKHRTLVKGVVVPTSVCEGIPIRVAGKHEVHAFQFNTQGHGVFWVLVDSEATKITWLQELLMAITGIPFSPKSANAILFPSNAQKKLSTKQMKAIVASLYAHLFSDDLEFSTQAVRPGLPTPDAISTSVHGSVVLSSNLPSSVPYWGEYHGLQGLCQFWKLRDETVERLKGRVLRMVADEDESTVVVMTSSTMRIVHNAEVVVEESCDIIELNEGLITSIHLNFDSAQLATSFLKAGLDGS
ncbi:hypothetical protein SDRG_08405 [Saprolegnia diclina VS20]|uniref:PH domain-containing protein n=1 Tax=Saprolegnia diclina (strain VS20) TaxID=1156394 RepID=T0RV04_SAPDV|nr:hypothetical protein SDRG_08405 [Saprolegnia diclina VS20]EQC34202.1 hypothetical protein SDRG_08405 [Saprolegnia diclina VS20]|eukprot:XP_008612514.1 hypothetical protein SDRG_08405 [Saprolegnia diclina VS20]